MSTFDHSQTACRHFSHSLNKCVSNINQVLFILTTEGSLMNKLDLPTIFLSGTYCHKTGTRPPSCLSPRQPTMHANFSWWRHALSIMMLYTRSLTQEIFSIMSSKTSIWNREQFFLNVGPPKESTFLTTFYGLYFSCRKHWVFSIMYNWSDH